MAYRKNRVSGFVPRSVTNIESEPSHSSPSFSRE
jgi:hypothetical protein